MTGGMAAFALAYGFLAQAPEPRPSFESFEVASIKLAAPEPGRFIKMQSAHRLFAKNFTLKSLIAAAYGLPPVAVLQGPAWIDTEHFDILAATPGEVRPNLDEQMAMLRGLLRDRFQLRFQRQEKTLSIYTLTVAKGGPKLTDSTAPPDGLPELISIVYPDHISLPAKNASIGQFAAMLQRAVLERPVVDKTGLTGRYDFTLEWAADESQFGGQIPRASGAENAVRPSLFAALREQLGLRLQAGKGPVRVMVVTGAERPSEN